MAAAPEIVKRFALDRLTEARPIILYEAVGCAACRNTGYLGRTAIGELLVMSDALHGLVINGADQQALQREAVKAGMRTMYDNGIAEMLAGRTTWRELMRSIRVED